MVLAALPLQWHLARDVSVGFLLSSAAVHAPNTASLLHVSWNSAHPISVCLLQ
jgi:hypothetical protein